MSTQRTRILTAVVIIAVLAAGPVAGIGLSQPANTWVKRSRRPASKDTCPNFQSRNGNSASNIAL